MGQKIEIKKRNKRIIEKMYECDAHPTKKENGISLM
jgi:hypothetical protein